MHHYQDLITLFNACFLEEYHTELVLGDGEPLYLPATEGRLHHTIYFAHGFFSSALHECAHWLIAGPSRRLQEDYGYWYIPDGRNQEQQALFQSVEVKPQAMEWLLSEACGFRFQFSIDNLDGEPLDLVQFKKDVTSQVLLYQQKGLPTRAKRFHLALQRFYGSSGIPVVSTSHGMEEGSKDLGTERDLWIPLPCRGT